MGGFPRSEPTLSGACCAGPDLYRQNGKFREDGTITIIIIGLFIFNIDTNHNKIYKIALTDFIRVASCFQIFPTDYHRTLCQGTNLGTRGGRFSYISIAEPLSWAPEAAAAGFAGTWRIDIFLHVWRSLVYNDNTKLVFAFV